MWVKSIALKGIERPTLLNLSHADQATICRSNECKSLFPERTRDLVHERLRQIGKRRAFTRLDKRLDRHAGNRCDLAKPLPFAV